MKDLEREKLLNEYGEKKKTGLEEAKKLDSKVKLGPTIFAYTFGIIGALILGVGMCLAMEILATGTLFITLGIIIGIIGITIISINYPVYTKIMRRQKEKYSALILKALAKDDN